MCIESARIVLPGTFLALSKCKSIVKISGLGWMLMLVLLTTCQKKKLLPETDKGQVESNQPLFTQISPFVSGLNFRNDIPESSTMNSMVYEYYYNGGGVAIGDIDQDGLPDVYLVSNLKENKLYKNKGQFRFEDITKSAKVKGSFGWSTGVTMADVNADGWLDIYVCKSGKGRAKDRENELFINNKDGTFTEAAAQFGLNFSGYSTQAAFFDYDRDGDLDVFLLNHNVNPINTNHPEEYKLKADELVGDKLFRNNNGKFIDVSKTAQILNNPLGFGLGVSIGDVNNDGWPDIYIGNDYIEPDYLYINNTDGTFSEQLKKSIKHCSFFSMGTDIADFNNDGLLDIVSLDMVAEDNYGIKTSMSGMNPAAFNHAVANGFHYQYMFNALQLNNGHNNFSEIAHLAGVSNTDWSWAPLLADFDNDGYKDLFVSNGLKRDFRNNDFRKYKLNRLQDAKKRGENMTAVMEELIAKTPQRKTANFFYKNNGDLTFSKTTKDWIAATPSFSNGAAYADLDADGDLDLIVNNIDEPAFVYQNNARQNYLQLELKGTQENLFGLGANVSIQVGSQLQVAENYPTRGYQSAVTPILHFGLGQEKVVDQVKVHWPDGSVQTLRKVAANQHMVINYEPDTSEDRNREEEVEVSALFHDITAVAGIVHTHQENHFDDFGRESLLPHRMSQLGPALAVADVNGDQLEDFFIGGAKGFPAELYFQQPNGSFKPSNINLWKLERAYEDVSAVFFDVDSDGDLDLYVASGGNEFETESNLLQDRIYLNDGNQQLRKNEKLLPKMLTSTACVKPFDYDEDGDLDLFVGGRQVPGKYPYPANSYLLQNDGGLYRDVTREVAAELVKPGMVTDAIWTDFNGDQQTDLILVGEWMPVRFFKNDQGRFVNMQPSFSPEKVELEGWWSCIVSADLDEDGDQDYVLGNLGLNYKYKASAIEPFEVYCNDFDDNGSQDIVLSYYNQGELYPLRGRECSSNQMPFLKEKFPTYHTFGSADLEQIYGADKLAQSLHLKVSSFASVILENLGHEKFAVKPLPNRAQISSVNGIIVDDFDQDGFNDLLIAGNLFQSEVETPRNDASVGLFLRNNGKGDFIPSPPAESGLYLDKDVKNLSSIWLADGTAAILVGNNNNQIQLIRIGREKSPL